MAENQKVAYVKLEGILYDDSVFRQAAYLAANHQGMAQRFTRFGQAILSRQLAKVLDTNDRVSALRLAFQSLRHMSLDRVQEISLEYVRDHGQSRMMDGGRKLLRRLQEDVDTIVVFSESIDFARARSGKVTLQLQNDKTCAFTNFEFLLLCIKCSFSKLTLLPSCLDTLKVDFG